MLIRFLFLVSFLLFAYKALAQRESLSTKYREDQFYISFGLQLQKENINGFKQNGFSNNFQVGFVRDIPLNDNGRIAMRFLLCVWRIAGSLETCRIHEPG